MRAHPLQWFADNVIETVPAGYPGWGQRVFPRTNQLRMFQAYSWRSFHESGEFTWKLMYDDGEDPVRFPFSLLSSSLMDVAADLFLENIRHVFLERALPGGTLAAHGSRIEPAAITRTALMTVEAEKDDIAAPGQTRTAQALCYRSRAAGARTSSCRRPATSRCFTAGRGAPASCRPSRRSWRRPSARAQGNTTTRALNGPLTMSALGCCLTAR